MGQGLGSGGDAEGCAMDETMDAEEEPGEGATRISGRKRTMTKAKAISL